MHLDRNNSKTGRIIKSMLVWVVLTMLFMPMAWARVAPKKRSSKAGVPSLAVYFGRMTDNSLGEIFQGNIDGSDSYLYSIEGGYELPENWILSQYAKPITHSIGAAFNLTYQDDKVGPIYEFNPYLYLTWQPFPWNDVVPITLRLGEGVSYATDIPYRETRSSSKNDTRRFLNLLIFEAGFGLNRWPHWKALLRYHHRSGAFGLYGARNSGSTAIGLGLRYRFDS